MKQKVSLRIDSQVLAKFRQTAHGTKKICSVNSVIKDFLDRHAGKKVLSPLGFSKDEIYVINMDEEVAKGVEEMSKKWKTSKSDIIRIAIYDWYLGN